MTNVKDDRYYAGKLLESLQLVVRHMDGVTEAAFSADEVLQDAMMFRLIQISENARKLTDSFKAGYPQIPWGDVYGLRNRIVHDYGNVDLHTVYETLAYDIPELLQSLEK